MDKIEKEVKLKIDSQRKILQKISGSGFRLCKRKHFEDNFLFDFDNRILLSRGCALRLRVLKDKSILTFKEPSSIFSVTKVRKEIETDVEDPSAMFLILEKLGLRVVFRYQKYRRIYKKGRVILSLDETPIGNFIELEGSEEEIIAEAKNLGYSPSDFIKESYMEIFLREKSEDMVFK